MRYWCLGLLIVGGLAWQGMVMAASSSFTTTFQYGEDTEAPTVPDPVTATPIAATQIDIAWGTSTDDSAVAGYQLFRNAQQIATTSQTFFSDTNLSPVTLYEYFVVAFDIFGNFSSSSITVATSTPALPVVDPVDPDRRPSGSVLLIERAFALDSSTNGARFNWETNLATQFVLRYGQTSELAEGTIQTSVYRTNHQTVISGLDADTEYFYELFVVDIFGRGQTLRTGSFRTDAAPDTTPPSNVAALTGRAVNTDVLLSWQNPIAADFAYVRVVRNHRFFPQTPTDGFVVYEGANMAVTDASALREYNQQYYTVFSYDSSGNRSSGAVTYVQRLTSEVVAPPAEPSATDEPDVSVPPAASTSTPVIEGMRLRPEDVVFIQEETQVVLQAGEVVLQADQSYVVTIPYAAVPERLKSIIITIQNPTDQRVQQSFLAEYKEATNRYEAEVPAFNVVGESLATVAVYDYVAAVMHELTIPVRFVLAEDYERAVTEDWIGYVWEAVRPLLLLLGLGLGLWWFIILLYRKDEDEDKDDES